MSLILNAIREGSALFRGDFLTRAATTRFLSLTSTLRDEDESGEVAANEEANSKPQYPRHSVETSIKYLASGAYKITYGTDPVWKPYRRNHKGSIAPRKTRRTCIRYGVISTGNPCPICRDEYLVLDHRNTVLLKQFISEHNGAILSYSLTGLCQVKHQELLVAVERAKDYGTITFDVPFRSYDYSEWYTPEQKA